MKDNFVKFYWGKLKSFVYLAAFAVLLISCSLDDENATDPIPVAFVSIYHASPDAPELDVYVDERAVNRLEFTDYTGYLNFYTGDRKFKINSFNASNTLIDTTVNFMDGGFYSVFIVNNLPNVETLTVRDSAGAPAEGKAKIRFINLSPDAASLDVSLNESTSLFTGQAFKQPSEFAEVDASESSFAVKTTGESDELVSVSDVDLRPGRFYTIIARGFANPPSGNNNALSLEVIVN
jgi:hypothetical protein